LEKKEIMKRRRKTQGNLVKYSRRSLKKFQKDKRVRVSLWEEKDEGERSQKRREKMS